MVQIAYSLMAFLLVLFIVQELCWTKIPNILSKSENVEDGTVKARTIGVAMWLSLGGLFLVLRTPPGKCMLTAGRCACVPAELCTHSA